MQWFSVAIIINQSTLNSPGINDSTLIILRIKSVFFTPLINIANQNQNASVETINCVGAIANQSSIINQLDQIIVSITVTMLATIDAPHSEQHPTSRWVSTDPSNQFKRPTQTEGNNGKPRRCRS